MKVKPHPQSNNTILVIIILFFIISIITNNALIFITNNALSSDMAYSVPIFEDSNQEIDFLWRIGEKTYFWEEFDQCSEGDVIEYVISGTESEDFSGFPSGIAKGDPCHPSEIRIRFSVNQDHVKNSIYMNVIGKGNVIVYLDAVLIDTLEIDSGFGSEEWNIPLPAILPYEHLITMKREDEGRCINFDFIWLIGYPDTDHDGASDQDEGTGDSDGDGLEDYRDEDCALISDSEGERILLMVRKKDAPGPSSFPVLRGISFTDTLSSTQGPVDGPPDIGFLHGFVMGHICNLEKDQEVGLIFSPPQSVGLYGAEQIWIYNDRKGSWVLPEAALDKENRRFYILLKDGDPEDADGKNDSHIAFNLGLGIPSRLPPYSMDSCFLASMKQK